VVDWYRLYVVDSGRSAALWALIGFLVAYAITRGITRHIRERSTSGTQDDSAAKDSAAKDSAVKDVYIGGVHIHHQVWGILLVLLVGLLEFRFNPEPPWQEILAVLFGIGSALALDEFALWLHLKDVYWSEEGRQSIDAVMVASVVGVALLFASSPIGLRPDSRQAEGLLGITIGVVFHICYTIVCLLKGKLTTGLVGLAIPLLALVGSLRLAKPESYWARRRYSERKMARAKERYGPRYQARLERLRDLFSGGRPLWGNEPAGPEVDDKVTRQP
jgi:hypothetical protein